MYPREKTSSYRLLMITTAAFIRCLIWPKKNYLVSSTSTSSESDFSASKSESEPEAEADDPEELEEDAAELDFDSEELELEDFEACRDDSSSSDAFVFAGFRTFLFDSDVLSTFSCSASLDDEDDDDDLADDRTDVDDSSPLEDDAFSLDVIFSVFFFCRTFVFFSLSDNSTSSEDD